MHLFFIGSAQEINQRPSQKVDNHHTTGWHKRFSYKFVLQHIVANYCILKEKLICISDFNWPYITI